MKLSEMTPREINATIAEKVMGWRLKHFSGGGGGFTVWVDDDERITYLGEDYQPFTDISDALDAVEKSNFEYFSLSRYYNGVWTAMVTTMKTVTFGNVEVINDAVKAEANNAPEAVCKAILKAVCVEIEE